MRLSLILISSLLVLIIIIVLGRGGGRVYIIELLVRHKLLLIVLLHRVTISIKLHLHRHIVHIVEGRLLIIITVVIIVVVSLLVIILITRHVVVVVSSLLSQTFFSIIHKFEIVENGLLRRSIFESLQHNLSSLKKNYKKTKMHLVPVNFSSIFGANYRIVFTVNKITEVFISDVFDIEPLNSEVVFPLGYEVF